MFTADSVLKHANRGDNPHNLPHRYDAVAVGFAVSVMLPCLAVFATAYLLAESP